MLLFSTMMDINEKMTREKFFELIEEWNEGQYYEENRIPGFKWEGQFGEKIGSERLWLSVEEYQSSVAVRFEKRNPDGAVWDTDYVMNFRNMKMAIRLERSYTEDALTVDGQFSAPYFITLLIDKGYLKRDNGLELRRGATRINGENIALLADVVTGKARYRLPVVYVSRTFENEDPVDVDAMAKKLRGMAHVFAQEDLSLNKEIQSACGGKNEYKGSIGIYFPNTGAGGAGHKKLKYRRDVGPDPMLMEKVIQSVLLYGNSQMADPLFTWQGVRNALLLVSLEKQREARSLLEKSYSSAEEELRNMREGLDQEERRIAEKARLEARSEANALLEMYDEEERKLRDKIEELTRANESLVSENDGLRQKLQSTDGIPLLTRGEEDDFYAGEVKDLVLLTLSEAVNTIPAGARRRDVVVDIINSNDYRHLTEENAASIKRLLKTYSGMSSKVRQELESRGFVITEDGKHYKVTYNGDPRYTMTMSKTPSDVKTGQNVTGTINRIVYG